MPAAAPDRAGIPRASRWLPLLVPLALAGCFGPPEASPDEARDPELDPSALGPGAELPFPPALPAVTAVEQALPPDPPASSGEERLQPGVVASVQVTDEPALSVPRTRVGRDGSLFLPFLGRFQAAGLTRGELAQRLERALSERGYLRRAQVHVEVLEQSGRQAYVLGRVGKPGAYDLPFHQALTLTQLIAMSGGLATSKGDLEADPSAILLIRTEGGKRTSYRVNFLDVVGQDDLRADVVVQDQDVVYVPPKRELFIFGSVRVPGGYQLADRARLAIDEALALAGGFQESADLDGILLVRRTSEGSQTYRIPSDPVARAGIQVTAGDTIIVPGRTVRRVYVLGSVGQQGGYPIDERDLTVTRVLSLAGGLSRIAAANSVRLIRRGSDGKPRVYSVPVAEIISSGDLSRDPVLLPGDLIWVPEGFF